VNGISNLIDNSFTWSTQNFAGFYYDIDDDLGTEKLITTITEGNKLQEPTGISYTTTVQKNDFDFEDWGFYNVIGFQANKYFAGYVNDENVDDADEILFTESTDENSLSDEQLEAILIDNDDEMTVTSGTPLEMEEGYELSIKSIDIDSNNVYLELTKDGSFVDSKVINPSKDNPTMADKTYYYKKDVGESKDLVIIAAHFKNAFRGSDTNLATIDGIWQISEEATEVKVDTEYDKMRIASVSADTITMDNKDNTVTLSKNKDIDLMGDVKILTSDQDVVDDANPQRYYIYKEATIEGEAAPIAVEPVEAGPVEEPAKEPAVQPDHLAAEPVEAAPVEGPEATKEAANVTKNENVPPAEKTDRWAKIAILLCLLLLFICSILIWINKEKIDEGILPGYIKPFLLTAFSMIVLFLAELLGTPFGVQTAVVLFGALLLGIILDRLISNLLLIISKFIADNILVSVISFYLNYLSLKWILFDFPESDSSDIEKAVLKLFAVILIIIINTYISEFIAFFLKTLRDRFRLQKLSDSHLAFLFLILFAASEIVRWILLGGKGPSIKVVLGAYQYVAVLLLLALVLRFLYNKMKSNHPGPELMDLIEKGDYLESQNDHKKAAEIFKDAIRKCMPNQLQIRRLIEEKLRNSLMNWARIDEKQIGKISWPLIIGDVKLLGIDLTAYPQLVISIFVKNEINKYGGLESRNFRIYEDSIEIKDFNTSFMQTDLDIALAFDDTESMKNIIDAMKKKVQEFVDDTRRHNPRYLLISFKDDVVMRTGWTSDPEEFKRGIRSLNASGGGDDPEASLDAVEKANSSGFREKASKFIILITDNLSHHRDDGSMYSKFSKDEVVNMIRLKGSKLIVVSPIIYANTKYIDMKQVAIETGGLHIDIQSSDFSSALETITNMITGFYNISYRTSGDSIHKLLKVELISPSSGKLSKIYLIIPPAGIAG
jgi:S-layer protein (TIGR01567 family)